MKTLAQILQKKYKQTIVKNPETKKKIQKMSNHLKEHKITFAKIDDETYLQMEIIYGSVLIKERFEDVFFDTYVKMFDYWNDLTYLERKKQMNVDVERLKEGLSCFMSGNQAIYMPCFDERFNHLYTDEIVLLDLKQYHAFIRDFSQEVKRNLYGSKPYQYNCTSATLMSESTDGFVLYLKSMNTLYLYKNHHEVDKLCFDMKKVPEDETILKKIANNLLYGQEEEIISLLIESELISERMKKKINKYQQKVNKKQKKAIENNK
ncbi:MAG: RNA polymerase subunit sigma [Longicatena sp.]